MPQLPKGIPIDILQELIKASESGNFGGYNALAWHPNYTPNAMDRPLGPTGFPQWQGSSATGLGSHGAGAYQFEPKLWGEFAPGLGVTDFSPESQDRVAAAALQRYGIQPWATNKPLQAAIRNYQQTGRMPAQLVSAPAGYAQSSGGAEAADSMPLRMPAPMQPEPTTMMAANDEYYRPNLGFGGGWGYY